jgi:hypothetical protein
MMEAVRTSKTSVHFNVTIWRYIPEDSKLHTRRENLKSHTVGYMLMKSTMVNVELTSPMLSCTVLLLYAVSAELGATFPCRYTQYSLAVCFMPCTLKI